MSTAPRDLAGAYVQAFERYVTEPTELALEAAYEIGREAMASGFGIVDLATTHGRVLQQLVAHPPPGCDQVAVADRAAAFLLESLSPFEMTLRGFGEAIARLQHEVAERTDAEEALRAARDHLEERVDQRTAELSAANERLRREVADRKRAETALREAELSYQALVSNIRDYAIFMLDPDGIVTTWTPGAQRIKGYLPHEIIGRHFSIFYTPEDREHERPQKMLAAAANGSHEDEGWRVRKDGSRYWADVTLTALRAEDGRLKGFTAVARDVTERRRAQQALEELNAQLRRLNEEKDQFVAMISHELRNPLSAIVSGVDVLRRSLPDDRRLLRTLDIIRRNADVQKRLVDDLLDLSRLRRDRLTLQRAPVALDTLAQGVIAGEEAEATRSGVTISVDVQSRLWVLGDADRLQQVMLNLLGNAIKFTPSGGRVRVTLLRCAGAPDSLGPGVPLQAAGEEQEDGGCVCIVVEDSGIGIDRALLPRLFNPFEQGDIASQRQRGLGLGLALVKLIAEKHGGTVWAESGGSNRGSRFVVALPSLRVEQSQDTAEPNDSLSLLLVEDNPDTRELLAAGLESKGYSVLKAGAGDEALALLGTTHPDLILSDLALPGMSGYDFARRARQLAGMATVPVFAVTAALPEQDVQRMREAGFVGHFIKPVDVAALDRAMRTWLAASRSHRT